MNTLDRFQALKDRQQAEADKLQAQAVAVSGRALSPKAVAGAAAAVLSVAGDKGRGGIGEPSSDLRDIRMDQRFAGPLMNDLRIADAQCRLLISGALALGYRSQIEGYPLVGAKLIYVEDDQTRQALAGYPILGETSAEHASAIVEALRRDVMRAVGLPLTGQADFSKVAEALGRASDMHTDRVGGAVSEAYFAGVQAGLVDATHALVGV